MSNNDTLGADIEIRFQGQRQLERAIAAMEDAADAMREMVDDANKAEKALNQIRGNVDVKVDVDDAEIDGAVRKAGDLDQTRSTKVNVNDGDLDAARDMAEELDETRTTKVDVDLGSIDKKLDTLINQGRIEIALDIIPAAGGMAMSAGGGLLNLGMDLVGLDQIIAVDTAVKRLQGTTQLTAADADHLIREIYTNGWGESIEEVQNAIAIADEFGVEIAELPDVVTRAFELASIGDALGKDLNVNELLRAQARLVESEAVPDFEAAGDLIATGLINGMDIGDDWLDTLFEYSPDFEVWTDSGEEIANLVAGGLQMGFRNSDTVADAVRELKIKLTQDIENEDIQGALSELGLLDEALDFSETLEGGPALLSEITTRLNNIEDAGDRARLAGLLFGTQMEDAAGRGMIALDPLSGEFNDIDGAAKDASDTINSDLGTALTTMNRTIRDEMSQFFNEKLDVTTFLNNLTEGVNTFFAELDEGTSFGDALSLSVGLALDDTPLGEFVHGVLRVLTDMSMALIEMVADVLDHFDSGAAADARAMGADIATFRFGVDIGTAENVEQLEEYVSDALERGVEGADIVGRLGEQLDFAIEQGDLESATALFEQLEQLQSGPAIDPAALGFSDENLEHLYSAVDGYDSLRDLLADNEFSANTSFPALFDSQTAIEDYEAWLDAVDDLAFSPNIDMEGVEFIDLEAQQQAIADAYTAAIDSAISAGDYTKLGDLIAEADVDLIGEETFNDAIEKADELRQSYLDAFNAAVESGDATGAEKIAEKFGEFVPYEVEEQLAELRDSTSETSEQVAEDNAAMASSTEESNERVTQSYTDTANTIETETARETEAITASQDAITEYGELTVEEMQLLQDAFTALREHAELEFPLIGQTYADMVGGIMENTQIAIGQFSDLLEGLGGVAMADPGVSGASAREGGGSTNVTNNSRSVNINVTNNSAGAAASTNNNVNRAIQGYN